MNISKRCFLKLFQCLDIKVDFHSVEFSDWTGNPLLMCENFAVNLNKMLRVTKILLSKIQSARKILLSGNQPLLKYLLSNIIAETSESKVNYAKYFVCRKK